MIAALPAASDGGPIASVRGGAVRAWRSQMTVKIDRYALIVLALMAVMAALIGVAVLSSSGAVNVAGLILTVGILTCILIVSLVFGLG